MVAEFATKVALVTGAGSGIGAATALRLARDGATVGVLDLLSDRVEQVCDAVVAAGGLAVPLTADVADDTAMAAAFARLIAATGRLDMIVANAGINGVWAPIDELTVAEWDRTIAVNLRGTFLTLRHGVAHLKSGGGGAIVIVASINGVRTFTTAGATAYSATKAAQAAMADQLALELARHRIRVNTICPGMTVTQIGETTTQRNRDAAAVRAIYPDGDIPLTGGVAATAADIADAIRLLLSDDGRHITGTRVFADGGQSLLR